jgi:hypothetical protein
MRARVLKRSYAGVDVFVIKSGNLFLVSKGGQLEYKSSSALTHKGAAMDAVLFWKKKGLI